MAELRDFLVSIGLGKNEVDVYLTLVDLGTSSVLDISKKTKVHRSNIYEALRSLVDQGIVFEINGPTKLFYARSPRGFLSYIEQKEVELLEIVKNYEVKRSQNKSSEKVKLSKGHFALREAIFNTLGAGEDIITYGVPKEASEIIGPMIERFHKERAKIKQPMFHIYNSDGVERSKYLNKKSFTESRILPKKYDSNTTTMVSGNKVNIILWGDGITVIEVDDENMSKQYRDYFNILWNKAKKF